MARVVKFTFNPFQENTYLVTDDSKECIVFDPGCLQAAEKQELAQYIEQEKLKVVRLINTHCHLDHVFGNHFIKEKYQVELEAHRGEQVVLDAALPSANMYGIPYPEPSPPITKFIEEGDIITFGNDTQLEAIFTPGHSPASLSFYCKEGGFIIAGDVLFQNSIGRTDLPGGDYNTLISVIKNKLFALGNDVVVYSGHGGETTIGKEKLFNPFLK